MRPADTPSLTACRLLSIRCRNLNFTGGPVAIPYRAATRFTRLAVTVDSIQYSRQALFHFERSGLHPVLAIPRTHAAMLSKCAKRRPTGKLFTSMLGLGAAVIARYQRGARFAFFPYRLAFLGGSGSSIENWSLCSIASARSRRTQTASPIENSRRVRSPAILREFS